MDPLPPLRLVPELRRRLWGGDGLAAWLDVDAPPGDEPVAEAWLAHHGSRVAGGAYDGARLGELIARFGARLIGTAPLRRYGAVMPLLVKFLDAADDLSVQVHPDDAYAAARHSGSGHLGKTESWRILEAAPGASVIWGFARPVSEAEVRAALDGGALGELLRSVPVTPGDVIHNPAGTVHAVGAGLRIYELQQASDLTYRLWDHGRVGADGRPRELHVEDALAIADLSGSGEPRVPARSGADGWTERVRCPFYLLEEQRLDGRREARTGPEALHVLTVLDGRADLVADGDRIDMPAGATVVVPAGAGPYRLDGRGTVLRARPVDGR